MDYREYQIQKEQEFEGRCLRCGNCCGLQDDPCVNLDKQADGRYSCNIYESRAGIQKTRSGREFKCVLIREVLHQDWPKAWNCVYRKSI